VGSSIISLPKAGGSPSALATNLTVSPDALALSATAIAYGYAGHVSVFARSGGPPREMVGTCDSPTNLVSDGTNFFIGCANATVYMIRPTGTAALSARIVLAGGGAQFNERPLRFATVGSSLYLAATNGITTNLYSLSPQTTSSFYTATLIASNFPPFNTLTATSTAFFWTTGSTIGTVPLAGGALQTIPTGSMVLSGPLAADNTSLYVFKDDDPLLNGMYALPIAGGQPVLAGSPPQATNLLVDPTNVYWADADGIFTIPK